MLYLLAIVIVIALLYYVFSGRAPQPKISQNATKSPLFCLFL